jgi:hypothetical protein
MQVTVTGGGTLLSQAVSVSASGKGTRYVPQAFSFVADGGSTTVQFEDTSPTTTDVDLFLDNVRVTAVQAS